MQFEIDFSDAKRGELTDDMLYNQYHDIEPNYKRFSNKVESITNLSFIVKKGFTNGISVNLGIPDISILNL